MIQKKKLSNLQEKDISVASIDIGTNSTHLLIADINLDLKSFSIKFTDKSTTRLGERDCLLYTSPSPRDLSTSRMPSSA